MVSRLGTYREFVLIWERGPAAALALKSTCPGKKACVECRKTGLGVSGLGLHYGHCAPKLKSIFADG